MLPFFSKVKQRVLKNNSVVAVHLQVLYLPVSSNADLTYFVLLKAALVVLMHHFPVYT